MYHAVLAALYNIGIAAYSHSCAISAFQKFFIERKKTENDYFEYLKKAQKLERKYSSSLKEARENRVKLQYGTQSFKTSDAEWIVDEAEEFVLRIEELLAH